MNFRELQEDVTIDDGSEAAKRVFGGAADAAKRAFQKFKDARQKAKDDIDAEIKDREEKPAETDDASKKNGENDEKRKAKLLSVAGPKTSIITAAGLILDRTPDAQDLPELDDLDAEHFNFMLQAADQLTKRFTVFSKGLIKTFRTAPFIDASDRAEIADRLGDQEDKVVDIAEAMLMQNKYGERDAWMKALLSDDLEEGAKALVNVIGKISTAHAKKNQAQNKKVYAEGLNLVNLIGAWRQIIEMRIGLFRQALDELSKKPAMSESLLKRVGKLAKRL